MKEDSPADTARLDELAQQAEQRLVEVAEREAAEAEWSELKATQEDAPQGVPPADAAPPRVALKVRLNAPPCYTCGGTIGSPNFYIDLVDSKRVVVCDPCAAEVEKVIAARSKREQNRSR